MTKTLKVITVLLLVLCLPLQISAQERWSRVPSTTPSMEIYIDKQSLIFETDNNSYSKTYNHKFVTAWVVYDDYQQGVTLKTYAKYNLTNSSFKFLTICRYTIEGELLDYMTTPDVNYSFIPPESNGENVLTTLWIYWLMHRDGLI